METIYIIAVINCMVNAFARHSRGLFFENKYLWQGLHSILLIALCIVSAINYGWIHILWILLIDFILYMPCVIILNKIIFKR